MWNGVINTGTAKCRQSELSAGTVSRLDVRVQSLKWTIKALAHHHFYLELTPMDYGFQ